MVQVTLRTPVHATEVPERVAQAASAFFPDLDCTITDGSLVGQGADIATFRDRVWELQIIDTVRSSMLTGVEGNVVRFRLSKQAALGGKVSLPPDRHALGDLDVKFTLEVGDKWADAEALCWWICPETEEGKIVGPTD